MNTAEKPSKPKAGSKATRAKSTKGKKLKKYHVSIREVHINVVEVKAASPEEAKEIAGANSVSESLFVEFSHTLDTDTWTVSEVE